jgi:hypothetical protein
MSIKLLVIGSDTHCGSEVGLSPRQFKLRKGNVVTIGDNLCQKWLADQWDWALEQAKKIVGNDEAALLINGDAIEGVHHRNEKELLAAEMDKHIEMAITCWKPWAALAKKTYVVKGTECHTAGLEDLLAQKIKAEGRAAKDKWLIRVHGCLVDAAHHMGVTSRAYLEASLMSIHMGNARLNRARLGQEVPKVYLRAHRHCGGWFSDGSGLFAVTGGWQFLTRHGHKVVTDSIPSPTILILDWRNKTPGELPQVHEIKCVPPKTKSPTREELIKSAHKVLDRLDQQRFIRMEEQPPPGWFNAIELANTRNCSVTAIRRLLETSDIERKTFKRAKCNHLRPVVYYNLNG